jgi:hypothetical protein
MIIWGNHSATQYPDFAHAKIGARPASEVVADRGWLEREFIETVQNRGTAVIKARGASSAASAANAAIVGVYNLTHDTPVDECYSVGRCSHGEYGVDPGLIFSFPSRTEAGVSRIVEGIAQDEFGRRKLAETLEELRKERDAVEELGLIAAKYPACLVLQAIAPNSSPCTLTSRPRQALTRWEARLSFDTSCALETLGCRCQSPIKKRSTCSPPFRMLLARMTMSRSSRVAAGESFRHRASWTGPCSKPHPAAFTARSNARAACSGPMRPVSK